MMRQILALFMAMALASAAIDQSYLQTVARDGSSTLEKSMEIAIFSNQLPDSVLQQMADFCSGSSKLSCSVDVKAKRVVITERFLPGGYYSSEIEYGLPFITQTVIIDRIPNDRFGYSLDTILSAANFSSDGSVKALNLRDQTNPESAAFLKKFKANITYTVIMPSAISSASSGNYSARIDNRIARFDFVQVLEQSDRMVVVGREINAAAIVAIIGILVLAALAFTFFTSRPSPKKLRKKQGNKDE